MSQTCEILGRFGTNRPHLYLVLFNMSDNNNAFTPRKKLNHDVPYWVENNPTFFITINTLPRGQNNLLHSNIIDEIKNSWRFYQSKGTVYVEYLLLMPDHLHMLIAFNDVDMSNAIRQWKRYMTRKTGVIWQSDFFDHRIRNGESHQEKIDYISNNPVRKGFVKNPTDWKHQWFRGMQELCDLDL